MHEEAFLTALTVFLAILIGVAVFYLIRLHKTASSDWPNLLNRLQPVDRENIALIAKDLQCRRKGNETELDTAEIWPLVGGMAGLEALEQNCGVLIDLAFYVHKWHPEAAVLAEELRLNARDVKWHLAHLKSSQVNDKVDRALIEDAQRAVATYYTMTKRVRAFYEQNGLPGLIDLQRAI